MAEAEPLLLRVDQADTRYNAALRSAVAACAADTAGQTCYICLEGAADEGLVRGCSCRGENGFVHVSCLVRAAQVAVERGQWERWHTCRLCEQQYHGSVACALGWACWKTYMELPETDWFRCNAMNQLGLGLSAADQNEDALSVKEATLAMERRLGASETTILDVLGNLSATYLDLGRHEEALQIERDIYSGRVTLNGEEHRKTLIAASGYATSLQELKRFEEAKSLLRKTLPVARRVLGASHDETLRLRLNYAHALYRDPGATLENIRAAGIMFEDIEGIARRVYGVTHPLIGRIEHYLRNVRRYLRTREEAAPGDVSSVCDQMAAMTPPGDP